MVADHAILFATTNPGKLRELRAVLSGLPIRVVTLDEFPGLAEPVEDAATFEGNAKLKALYYAKLSGCWTIADDSGLEVDALGGDPGVHSARYAGEDRDDDANNARLIRKLAGVPPEKRTARFRCAIVLATAQKVLAVSSGVIQGVIVDRARGQNGFGYDPHFFVAEHGLTTAQMSPEQKNRISHRGQALRAIRPAIEELISGGQVAASDE